MLAELTPDQFLEWRVFDQLEIMSERRMDYRFASIVLALRGGKLDDCVIKFGDEIERMAEVMAPKQSLEFQEMLIDGWCHVHNIMLENAKSEKQNGS
ncbi:MAG TPA: hypothetical protein VK575_11735 [Gemmatimonadaceae bacterium]|nr:hypothetical protein [Gemmatimonadaceae bacterium]